MGVAGQIFAARVAIGLAVPSPKALSQTGEMLGNFSKKMYKKLNSHHLEAAQERSQVTTQELQRANARVAEFQKRSQAELMQSAQRSLNRTNKMFSGQVASSSRQVQQMRTGLQRATPALAPKLFANINTDMKSAEKYQRIMKNFIELNNQERQSVIKATEITLEQSKVRSAAAAIRAKEFVEEQEYAASLIEDAQALEKTYEQMLILDKERSQEKRRLAEEEKNLLKDQKDARDSANESLKIQEDLTNELTEAQNKLHDAMQKAVYTMKEGFGQVLRDSISILTGFYYKLGETTSALQVFERELLNANSVFNLTRDELFKTSQTIVQFGQEFGLAMDNGAAGLYQLASAGLDANEAMSVLPHTLKLSMAVQGDHNTISKLTAQTLFGFGMEMDQAGLLTDKFAHAIQKSLIEYEDLTSAIKFALPFFTATGQSIDQLLGSLQVLTNRALEAGIAGRGLRQALAEFAEGAEDNATAFASMGINILDANGEMLQLTEIARLFADVVGPETASNTELLTALIQDLNVRGATAFIHLVQNAEEFEEAVQATVNAGGELDEMVRIQNESISAQMQILKNNVEAIFFMRDANADGTESLNEFHQGVLDVIASLRGLIVEELADGTFALTQFGRDIRKIAVQGVELFAGAVKSMVNIIREFSKEGFLNISMLKAYFMPVSAVLKVVQLLGPNVLKLALWIKLLTAIIPVNTLLTLADTVATIANNTAKVASAAASRALAGAEAGRAAATNAATTATLAQTSSLGSLGGMLKGLGRALMNPYVAAAALVAVVGYLVLRTMDLKAAWDGLKIGFSETLRMLKYAVSPLTEMFTEWGEATERAMKSFGFSDNRAFMIGIMQEIGSIVALITFAVAKAIATVLQFIADLAHTTVDIVLGPNLENLIWAIKELRKMDELGAGNYTRDVATGGASTMIRNYQEATGQSTYDIIASEHKLAADAAYGTGGDGYWGTQYSPGGMFDYVMDFANGGKIPAYANGGPILVGERGPELIIPPRMGGQVLNTDRTRNLLRGQTGMSNGNGMINTLIVQNLTAANSTSNNSKIAVDTFAGVV
tara:strand:+ start:7828 stop:11016 length:3189 start_codon:yes stop_codon:yes gene_type:complete